MAEKRLHSDPNAEVVRRFEEELLAEGLTQARVAKYLSNLKTLAEHLRTGFEEATKEDIRELILWVESSDYSPRTKQITQVKQK
jgi:hypothetical protein